MSHIIFIDDDPVVGWVYEKQLALYGFTVERVTDGEMALNALQKTVPDGILLDLMLPKISGVELLEIIRGTAQLDSVPIVVFTNAFQKETLEKVRQLGVGRILSKSECAPKDVVVAMREVLRLKTESSPVVQAPAEVHLDVAVFRREVDANLTSSRRMISELRKSEKGVDPTPALNMLKVKSHKFVNLASTEGMKMQAYFCEALSAFFSELADRSGEFDDSVLRTASQAVDFLFELFDPERRFMVEDESMFRVLVVDDNPISRKAINVALNRIKQRGAECGESRRALEICEDRGFDLIFVDVEMPGLDGYELCAKLRRTEKNSDASIIFVTSHNDLQNRALSRLSGGDDFISKPFQFMELAVKTLIHLLRKNLRPRNRDEDPQMGLRT